MMEKSSSSDGQHLQDLSNGHTKLHNDDYIQEIPIERNRRRLSICSEETGAQANNTTGMLNTAETGISALFCHQWQKVFKDDHHVNSTGVLTEETTHKYNCRGMAFSRKDQLNEHLSSHTKHNYDENCKQSNEECSPESNKREEANVSVCSLNSGTQDMNSTSIFKTAETQQNALRCHYCYKVFKWRSELLRHIRTHTGEKPFACSVCSKTFSQKVNLRTHFRIHTGEKPYVCSFCDRTFTRVSHRTSHMNVHTRGESFTCEKCDESYTSKDALLRHRCGHSIAESITRHVGQIRFDGRMQSDGDQSIMSGGERKYCGASSGVFRTEQKPPLPANFQNKSKSPISTMEFRAGAILNKPISLPEVEYPFVCSYCDERFKRRIDLERHITQRRKSTCISWYRSELRKLIAALTLKQISAK